MKPYTPKTTQEILNQIEEHQAYFEGRAEATEYFPERDVMKLSLGVTLYFYKGHTLKVREQMPKIVKAYYDLYGNYITGGYIMKTEESVPKQRAFNQKIIDKSLDPKIWNDVTEVIMLNWSTELLEDCSGYNFNVYVENPLNEEDLSSIHASILYSHIDELEGFKKFIELICSLIPLHSGYAGFFLELPQQNWAYMYHQTNAAHRFYGCEVDDFIIVSEILPYPISEAAIAIAEQALADGLNPLQFANGIKGINWLTILGQPFVERMGGIDALHNKTTPYGLTVKTIGENTIIQAGELPDLCDAEDLPMNPYYVAVNHILEPIRKDSIGSLHTGDMFGRPVMGDAASDQWLHRFDQYPMPDIMQQQPTEPETPPIVTPPSRYTGYSVAVGEICQETGHYECPRMLGKTVVINQGQKVIGDAYNEMGAIIWYKLTKEAEREYLDSRKNID